jgi:hypothetical protein
MSANNSYSTLSHGNYEFNNYGYIKPPQPKLNGGLYTGEPFYKNAPYGNIPIMPDNDTMMAYLRNGNVSGKGPYETGFFYPSNYRVGNNHQEMKGVSQYKDGLDPRYAFQCIVENEENTFNSNNRGTKLDATKVNGIKPSPYDPNQNVF